MVFIYINTTIAPHKNQAHSTSYSFIALFCFLILFFLRKFPPFTYPHIAFSSFPLFLLLRLSELYSDFLLFLPFRCFFFCDLRNFTAISCFFLLSVVFSSAAFGTLQRFSSFSRFPLFLLLKPLELYSDFLFFLNFRCFFFCSLRNFTAISCFFLLSAVSSLGVFETLQRFSSFSCFPLFFLLRLSRGLRNFTVIFLFFLFSVVSSSKLNSELNI